LKHARIVIHQPTVLVGASPPVFGMIRGTFGKLRWTHSDVSIPRHNPTKSNEEDSIGLNANSCDASSKEGTRGGAMDYSSESSPSLFPLLHLSPRSSSVLAKNLRRHRHSMMMMTWLCRLVVGCLYVMRSPCAPQSWTGLLVINMLWFTSCDSQLATCDS
jgi:hypothetical protein